MNVDEDIPPLGDEEDKTFTDIREDAPSQSLLGGLLLEAPVRRRRSSSASSIEQLDSTRTNQGAGGGAQKRNKTDLMEQMRAEVMDMTRNLLLPVIKQQSSSMAEFGGQMVTAISGMKGTSKAEKEGKPEEAKTIQVSDFADEEDDATTVFGYGIRNALRPFCCPPKDYWGGVCRLVAYHLI